MTKHDNVNHPSHYTSHPSGVECIEITRHMNFNIGNAIKYLWRAGLKSVALMLPWINSSEADRENKDKHIEDLEKAIWYINDEIKRLQSEE